MIEKEFDQTVNTRMSSKQNQAAGPETEFKKLQKRFKAFDTVQIEWFKN